MRNLVIDKILEIARPEGIYTLYALQCMSNAELLEILMEETVLVQTGRES